MKIMCECRDAQQMNIAVFTTIYVMKHNEPILQVFHHEEDGAWEFTGETQPLKDSEYMLISWKEMVETDVTVLALLDLPLGKMASRNAVDALWEWHTI